MPDQDQLQQPFAPTRYAPSDRGSLEEAARQVVQYDEAGAYESAHPEAYHALVGLARALAGDAAPHEASEKGAHAGERRLEEGLRRILPNAEAGDGIVSTARLRKLAEGEHVSLGATEAETEWMAAELLHHRRALAPTVLTTEGAHTKGSRGSR